MRKMRRKIAVLLVFVLAFTMMPQNVLAAKKKVKLSKKSVTVTVGKTVKVKLKNNKKKVKWTVTSGRKNVKLSKKKKTGVTIHGKKAGKAKVQAKVGKKKFVCKVTVKKAGTNQNTDKNNGKKTAKPTVKPTEKPVLPSTPTPKPTEKPSLPSTPTPKPTEKPSLPSTPTPKPDNKPDPTPIETMMPPDETPAPTVKPESNYQGLYAEKEPLIVSSVAFEKDVPSYSLNYNDIYVISEEADSLKEFVPDVTKCTYNVYCYGKKAEVKSITDVVWHDDEEWQKPYYSFLLTAVQGGKEYKQTVTMKLVREDSEEGSENGMTWLSLDADGEKYELEQSLHDEEGESGYYFKDNSQRLKACLDNLMLTQGWNRFNVEDILKEQQKNPKYFMEIGQTISGKVLDIRNKPLSGKTVNVFVNKRPYPSTHTDNDGVFIVDKLSFADTARVEAQVIEKGKFFRANIRIDRDYFPEAVNTHPYKDAKYEQQNEYIEEMQSPFVREDGVLMLRLPEVVINARTLVKDRFSSYKIDDEEMLTQQDARTALDLVKNVPGFRIIDNRPYINPKYSQRPEHLMSNDVNNRNALRPKEKIDYGRTARFMLDNKTISFNALSLINAEDIVGVHKIDPEVDAAVNITQNLKYLEAAYNEAFESGATLEELEELEVDRQLQKMKDGTQSISGGCIVLTSRTGNLEIPRTSQGDTAFLLGFNRYKSFYSPKYVTDEERKSLVPDNRTTIYWQTQLRTDEKGNASVHFYTADRPSYYTIIIEGITDKGVPCRYEHLLKR